MNSFEYLLKEDIIESHKEGYTLFGGSAYAVDDSCVESRVVEPQIIYWGLERHPGLFKKAAVYFYKIIISHCFADGNKRAAFIATDLFLKLNGYKLNVKTNLLYDYCLKIANHETRPSLEDVEHWIREHVEIYDSPY